MHGVHMLCFLLLLFTGVGFFFRVEWISALFGGPAAASVVHRVAAVIFTVGPGLYTLMRWERFCRFIDTISTLLGKDDRAWFLAGGGYIPFLRREVPEQDKDNAGQKMLAWIVIIGCLLFILTGYPMWFLRDSMP